MIRRYVNDKIMSQVVIFNFSVDDLLSVLKYDRGSRSQGILIVKSCLRKYVNGKIMSQVVIFNFSLEDLFSVLKYDRGLRS